MRNNQNHDFGSSRLFSLLLLTLLLAFNSCNKKNRKKKSTTQESIEVATKKNVDSITISIRFKENKNVILNVYDRSFRRYTINFNNKSAKDSILYRKLPKEDFSQVIFYGYFDGKTKKMIKQFFLVDYLSLNLEFDLVNNKLKSVNKKNKIFMDNLFADYLEIISKQSKGKVKKKQLIKELEALYRFYKQKYESDKLPLHLQNNDLWYMASMEYLKPLNFIVDDYVKNTTFNIIGDPSFYLMSFYVKNRIDNLNYEKLNTKFFSTEYIKFMSLGVFNFLRIKENKGDKKYQPAIDWLKTTDFYKNDSINIKKEITPLNNTKFKKRLKSLVLLDDSFTETSFPELLSANPSQYYLIDFWATWCAPCIDGIKRIHDMDIPKNVKVINLSTDKLKDQQKWKLKSKELNIKIDALIKSDEKTNKEFLKFIEMVTIPRYILIDKNLNLIDEAFYRPHEPQFLEKIKDIKNWKRW